MFDTNQTGTIDMNEFGRLFAYIQQWKAMFENFDRDRLVDSDDHGDHHNDHDHDDVDHDIVGRLFAYIQQWQAMFENFDRDRFNS